MAITLSPKGYTEMQLTLNTPVSEVIPGDKLHITFAEIPDSVITDICDTVSYLVTELLLKLTNKLN